jgi:hypothetical protein
MKRSYSFSIESGEIVPTNESGYKYNRDQLMDVNKSIKFLERTNQVKPTPDRTQRIRENTKKQEHYRKEWYWYLTNIIN